MSTTDPPPPPPTPHTVCSQTRDQLVNLCAKSRRALARLTAPAGAGIQTHEPKNPPYKSASLSSMNWCSLTCMCTPGTGAHKPSWLICVHKDSGRTQRNGIWCGSVEMSMLNWSRWRVAHWRMRGSVEMAWLIWSRRLVAHRRMHCLKSMAWLS